LVTGGKTTLRRNQPADKMLAYHHFENDVSVHLNGEDIHAIHFPNGHTDGDT